MKPSKWFISRHDALKSWDVAVAKVYAELLLTVDSGHPNQAEIKARFGKFVDRARDSLRGGYWIPVRPILKWVFDKIWEKNYVILFDSRRDARIHNTAGDLVAKVLREFGEGNGILDPPMPCTMRRDV